MWSKLFSSKAKSPADVVKSLRESLDAAQGEEDSRAVRKTHDDVSRAISSLKVLLFGDASNDIEVKPQEVEEVVKLACDDDLLILIVRNMSHMEFETRKDAVQIVNNLLRRDADGSRDTCAPGRMAGNGGDMLVALMDGYDTGEIALNCGSILRECIRRESMAKLLMEKELFWRFFGLVEVSDFDVASDAFSTFKEALTKHVKVSAQYIEEHMDKFVTSYNELLRSQNYVTRRQSLKLLGEMLLERANFKILQHYIGSPTNLRLVMNLLLDNRKNIQFEAFHVFKIFVANPQKAPEVKHILIRNKDKMLAYLTDFLADREDEQFQEDRQLVLHEIRELSEPTAGEVSAVA